MIRHHLVVSRLWEPALNTGFPAVELVHELRQDFRYAVNAFLKLHHASVLPREGQRCTKGGREQRTWVAGRPCTGSRSCSLCRTGTVVLRHTFAFANGSGYTLGWRAPAFAVSAARCHSRSCTESARRAWQERHTAAGQVVEAGHDMAVRWGVMDLWRGCIHLVCCH